jgi:hypothetical protein
MAKSKSILDHRGTYGGITFVKSRAYGAHIRTARGTFKKAKLNAACKQQSKQLIRANRPAKIFKDAIAAYRDGLEGGRLWRNLISMFNRQLEEFASFDFSKLQPFEIRPDYPFDRFLSVQPDMKVNKNKSALKVSAFYGKHPSDKSTFIDGYKLTVIDVFPDLDKGTAKTVGVESEIMGLKGRAAPIEVQLDIPPGTTCFLVCIKIEGCLKETSMELGRRWECGWWGLERFECRTFFKDSFSLIHLRHSHMLWLLKPYK